MGHHKITSYVVKTVNILPYVLLMILEFISDNESSKNDGDRSRKPESPEEEYQVCCIARNLQKTRLFSNSNLMTTFPTVPGNPMHRLIPQTPLSRI